MPLYQMKGQPEVYELKNGVLEWIPSYEEFLARGYKDTDVSVLGTDNPVWQYRRTMPGMPDPDVESKAEIDRYLQWQEREFGIPGMVASPAILQLMLAERTGSSQLASQERLGMAGLSSQERVAQIAADREANALAAELGIRREELASTRAYQQGQLGIQRGQLGIDSQRLGVESQRAANELELGRGKLGIEKENLGLQRELGTGRLKLDEMLGLGQLRIGERDVATRERKADLERAEFDNMIKQNMLSSLMQMAQSPLVQWYTARGQAVPQYMGDIWNIVTKGLGVNTQGMPAIGTPGAANAIAAMSGVPSGQVPAQGAPQQQTQLPQQAVPAGGH